MTEAVNRVIPQTILRRVCLRPIFYYVVLIFFGRIRTAELLRLRLFPCLQWFPEACHTDIVLAFAGHLYHQRRCLEADRAWVVGATVLEERKRSKKHATVHTQPIVAVEHPMRALITTHSEVWTARNMRAGDAGPTVAVQCIPWVLGTARRAVWTALCHACGHVHVTIGWTHYNYVGISCYVADGFLFKFY